MTRYLIVENERLAREELYHNVCSLRPQWECVGYAETVEEVVGILGKNKDIDLVFMDIELDDGQCFEIFERIDTEVSIIFTTAYSEFAIQAFHLNSLDYLLKPFSIDALESSIKKYEYFSDRVGVGSWEENTTESDMPVWEREIPKANAMPRILIQQSDSYSFIPIEKVRWLECEDKYVYCVDDNGRKWMTGFKSLREFEHLLPAEMFCKLRRNVIASISSVTGVYKFFKGSLRVRLCAGDKEETVVVPQPNKNNVLLWLGMH
ncbi:MAG: LytTR family DNA-binding domain-containing protein [Muribaculaceae bacterium]|nr:LytTR family DNA-binding domain-containing protein [Muribaculaceae bacterium]